MRNFLYSSIQHLHENRILASILLILFTLMALCVSNVGYYEAYDAFFHTKIKLYLGERVFSQSILHIINDTLMVLFFFHVGIELKYEFVYGDLNNIKTALLPLVGAVGGMVVPALMYLLINFGDLFAYPGWAIPAATDIAFAVGFIAMLGKRVPPILHAFLLAIAVFDDIGAIAIIALFYIESLQSGMLLLALATIGGLAFLKRASVKSLTPYLSLGVLLWFFVFQSGLHATLAGVIVAFFVPSEYPKHLNQKPGARLMDMEHNLYGYVYYLILPIFAFANTGINLGELSFEMWLNSITLGVGLGLVIGKPLGIMLMVWVSVRMQLSSLPKGLTFRYLFGISLLCGIGFTMSLFISDLAFGSDLVVEKAYALGAKLGILLGSMISCMLGMFWLYRESRTRSVHTKIDQ